MCRLSLELASWVRRTETLARYVHGHQNRRGYWRVLQLRQVGYLTVSDSAQGARDRDPDPAAGGGTVYPWATRITGIPVYREVTGHPLRAERTSHANLRHGDGGEVEFRERPLPDRIVHS